MKSGDKVKVSATGEQGVIAHVIKDRISGKPFYQVEFTNGKYDIYSKRSITPCI